MNNVFVDLALTCALQSYWGGGQFTLNSIKSKLVCLLIVLILGWKGQPHARSFKISKFWWKFTWIDWTESGFYEIFQCLVELLTPHVSLFTFLYKQHVVHLPTTLSLSTLQYNYKTRIIFINDSIIILNRQQVSFTPNFKLILHTNLSNPNSDVLKK